MMRKANIYLYELQTQIDYAKRAYKNYLKAKEKNDTLSIFYHAHHFVIHVSSIDKILDFKNNNFRQQIFKGILKLNNAQIKTSRRLRNHLEHFDERLDLWIKKHYDRGCAFFDMNITTGAKGFPKGISLRSLDGDNFCFYGETFNLSILYKQIKKIEIKVMAFEKRLKDNAG
jgi:hypothetical protein